MDEQKNAAQLPETTPEQSAQAAAPEQAEKTFTQAEVNEFIKTRLERERKKLPSEDELKAFRSWQENQKTEAEKTAEKIRTAQEAQTAAEKKAAELEAKYAAVSKGVKADAVEDVIALARNKISENVTIGQAIDDVLTRYPHFGTEKPGTTGVPTPNNNSSAVNDAVLRAAMGLSAPKN